MEKRDREGIGRKKKGNEEDVNLIHMETEYVIDCNGNNNHNNSNNNNDNDNDNDNRKNLAFRQKF